MKKQNVNFVALCATALITGSVLLGGCSNEEHFAPKANENNDGPVALKVNSDIKTRAANGEWNAQDAIGIYMVNAGTQTVAESAVNRKYIASTTGSTSGFQADGTNNIIYFPTNESNVDFLLYYPHQTLAGNDYVINVADQSNLPAIDLMTAKVEGKNKLTPAITPLFSHLLSKIELTIKAGTNLTADELKELTIAISKQRTAGSYNVLKEEMTVTAEQNGTDITLNTLADGTKSEALLIPTTESNGINPIISGRQLTFTLKNGETFKWSFPEAKQFAAGAKNIYNITINRTSLGLSATINDWTSGNGEGESGDAE